MKTNTLRDALRCYMANGNIEQDSYENAECRQMLEQLDQIDKFGQVDCDLWNNEVYAVSAGAAGDVVNHIFYDMAGRVLRHNPEFDSRDVLTVLRSTNSCEVSRYPDQFMIDGLDFVVDLWRDNEATGDNDTDGTFKREITVTTDYKLNRPVKEVLKDARDIAIANAMCNCEVMDHDDLQKTLRVIADLCQLIDDNVTADDIKQFCQLK